MTTNIDIYRAANLLVDRYGEGATVEAMKRADALAAQGDAAGKVVWLRILEAVEDVNHDQKEVLVNKVKGHFNQDLKGKTFTVWGLSFKPNTNDTREAPAAIVISKLLKAGCRIKAFDPVAMEEFESNFGEEVVYTKDRYEALIDSYGLILVTEWSEFRILNYPVMKKLMKEKVIFDGRNIYDSAELEENGFKYYGIGRN